jgi:hypothetical protein
MQVGSADMTADEENSHAQVLVLQLHNKMSVSSQISKVNSEIELDKTITLMTQFLITLQQN